MEEIYKKKYIEYRNSQNAGFFEKINQSIENWKLNSELTKIEQSNNSKVKTNLFEEIYEKLTKKYNNKVGSTPKEFNICTYHNVAEIDKKHITRAVANGINKVPEQSDCLYTFIFKGDVNYKNFNIKITKKSIEITYPPLTTITFKQSDNIQSKEDITNNIQIEQVKQFWTKFLEFIDSS